jgi:hypothetical protein
MKLQLDLALLSFHMPYSFFFPVLPLSLERCSHADVWSSHSLLQTEKISRLFLPLFVPYRRLHPYHHHHSNSTQRLSFLLFFVLSPLFFPHSACVCACVLLLLFLLSQPPTPLLFLLVTDVRALPCTSATKLSRSVISASYYYSFVSPSPCVCVCVLTVSFSSPFLLCSFSSHFYSFYYYYFLTSTNHYHCCLPLIRRTVELTTDAQPSSPSPPPLYGLTFVETR